MQQLQMLMKTDESPFDFNVLFPYPERLEALDIQRQELEEAGTKWSDLPKDGYNQGGYEWCIENWGTKWNAFDISIESEKILFNTAWATPMPIWNEIARRIPAGVQMVVEYADEDKGANCGILIFQHGELLSEVSEDAMPDPVLFARAIIYEQRAGEYRADYRTAEKRIKDLEAEIKALRNGSPPPVDQSADTAR